MAKLPYDATQAINQLSWYSHCHDSEIADWVINYAIQAIRDRAELLEEKHS